MMSNEIWLQCKDDQHEPLQIGNKAAALWRLSGLRVPPFFVVRSALFHQVLQQHQLWPLWQQYWQTHNEPAAEECRQQLLQQWSRLQWPSGFESALLRSAEQLISPHYPAWLLRSSSTVEDSVDASFAGLFHSERVTHAQQLLPGISRCWRAMLQQPLWRYWQQHVAGGAASPPQCAVMMQQYIPAQFSGVLFTVNPHNGDPATIAIEYVVGSAEALLQGRAQPRLLLINKITLQPLDNNDDWSVLAPHLQRLIASAVQLEQHHQCYIDLEWLLDANTAATDRLVVVQWRPETVWSKKNVNAHTDMRSVLNFMPRLLLRS